MRVFLTGATGFIGSHLARRMLRDGCRVTALVRPGSDTRRIADVAGELELLEGDLTEPERLADAVAEWKPEIAFHMAWYAVPGKYLEAPENVECVTGSLRLLQALHAAGCPRTVIAGTCFEYDHEAGYLSERSPVRPRSLYAASKHALYLTAGQLQRLLERSLLWTRIFYQYGPYEDPRRLVPYVARKLLEGEPCPFSPGEQVRDFLHVADVADAIWTAARSPLEGAVNIGSSRPVTVADVALEIARLLGREELLQLGARPTPEGDPPFIVANTQLLQSTGWKPRYGLRDGLGETLEWWKRQDAP
jgi:nucleoside-diphosphate-sugar epimerase